MCRRAAVGRTEYLSHVPPHSGDVGLDPQEST
jgi:hypothetical protein